jgi:hypothetical protein
MSKARTAVQTVYQWRPRTTFNIDPQVAGLELEKIRGHNSGDLAPEAVVLAAKDDKSPLHSVFEWNDEAAGHQYRLQQASLLIRAIVVTTMSGGASRSEPLRASVQPVETPKGASSARVVSAEELHRQRVERGWEGLVEWRQQFGSLSEFAAVAAMIDGLTAARTKAKAAA